jgi:kinesin family protein 22
VFGEGSTNADVFAEVSPAVDRVIRGLNCTIFAYGITCSGKTHTMSGSKADPGVIPRVVRRLFERLAELAGHGASGARVEMSFMEIYNEKVFDLLEPSTDLPIREDATRAIFVPGLAQRPVRSPAEFEAEYERGCSNRRSAPTALNANSSRSHAVLSITVRCRGEHTATTGKLHLCDLAGSEDNRHTGNQGLRLQESSSINTSLFTLGLVVEALRTGRGRVPYRDSKLTRFLQDSLGGSSLGLMIANIAPGRHMAAETQRTLVFAAKSRQVVNTPIVHVVPLAPPPVARVPLRPLGIAGPAVRPALASTSFLREDVMQKLARKAQTAAPASASAAAALPAQGSFLTPLTQTRALEQIKDRAVALEDAGELGRALAVYEGALALVGEDNQFICGRIARLRDRIGKENRTNVQQPQPPAPQQAPPPLALKVEPDDEEEAYEPEEDAEEPGTIEKKRKNKAPAKKRERVSGGNKGSGTKKIKSPLADVEVSAGVVAKLLDLCATGTLADLLQLQGVGKQRAQAILAHRASGGSFASVEDLGRAGMGKKTVENFLKRNVFVLGEPKEAAAM